MGARADVHAFFPLCAVLTVLRAFPCRSRLGDADTAATMEEEVRGHTGWAGVDTAVRAPASWQLAGSVLETCANECV